MDKSEFWKNFHLGTELEVAGRFVYNGLRSLHQMETLESAAEIFEVLYNLAVGLERLLKIAVILIEHDAASDQEKFEESLITHIHPELLARVRRKYSPPLDTIHNQFLSLLAGFYKTHRYGRYTLSAIGAADNEKLEFRAFLKKHLRTELQGEGSLFATLVTKRERRFVGKLVGKICCELYKVITEEARRLDLYTYELASISKSAQIFLGKKYGFEDEEVLWKELLLYFSKRVDKSGPFGFLAELEPLEFDPGLDLDHLRCFSSDEKKLEVLGELEALYGDLKSPGKRLAHLLVVDDPGISWDFDGAPEKSDEEPPEESDT